MDDWFDSLGLLKKIMAPLAFTSAVSSIASLSLIMRNRSPTLREVVAAVFSSISASVIVFLMLYEFIETAPGAVYGAACLSGAGGAATLDFLLIALRNWSVRKGLLKPTDIDRSSSQKKE